MPRLFTLRGGAYAWRADGLRPYAAYAPWQPPPEPESTPGGGVSSGVGGGSEPFDGGAALEELVTLGLASNGMLEG